MAVFIYGVFSGFFVCPAACAAPHAGEHVEQLSQGSGDRGFNKQTVLGKTYTHISEKNKKQNVHRYMLISSIIFSYFHCTLSVGAADVCPAWRADLRSSRARLHQHLQSLQPSECYFSAGGTRSVTQGGPYSPEAMFSW